MSLTISLPPDVARRIADEAAREGLDAPSLVLKILLTSPGGSGMSEREAELVAQIHRLSAPKSLSEQRRYQRLRRKNQAGALTEAEREQLFALIDTDELRAAERLEYLGELAQLRSASVREVMKSLGLRVPSVA